MSARDIALQALKIDEGLRLKPYECTAGKQTIGYGRNLDDVGISEAEAEAMLASDIKVAAQDAKSFATSAVWEDLSPERQAVLINMAFNLGLSRLSQFKRLRTNLALRHYVDAAAEMLNSRWAKQVPNRARRLADIMRGA